MFVAPKSTEKRPTIDSIECNASFRRRLWIINLCSRDASLSFYHFVSISAKAWIYRVNRIQKWNNHFSPLAFRDNASENSFNIIWIYKIVILILFVIKRDYSWCTIIIIIRKSARAWRYKSESCSDHIRSALYDYKREQTLTGYSSLATFCARQ